jgi:integrase
MIGKITVAALNGLEGWLWDEKVCGLGARKQRRGTFFYLRYRHQGRQQMHSIGRFGSPWTPDTARAKALELLGMLSTGVDPFAQSLSSETFGAEIERYLARKKGSLKPRSFVEVQRYLQKCAAPLHRLKLEEIDRRKIAVLLAEIETSRGPTARNRTRTVLSAMFTWAIQEGLVDLNPVQGTAKAAENRSRERVLSQEELRKLWHSLGDDRFSNIIRLLLLTGCRRNEIGKLAWSEINPARKMIVLPPERTKNGRPFELPLSAQASAIIERTPRRNSSDFLFAERGFNDWDRAKQELDERLNIAPWRLHDLRRTCASQLGELGVLPHYIEAILNHQSGHKAGVAGIYNRARYTDEMRSALQRWADHVERITA